MKRKGPPFQVVLIMATMGILMIISWLSVSSPESREENKARNTLTYFLEALGRTSVERVGKELHPTTLRKYNPETLETTLKSLNLDKPLAISYINEGEQSFEPQQWKWMVNTQTPNADDQGVGPKTPLIVFIQYPEEMKMSRRWHVRSVCRPQQELEQVTQALIAQASTDSEDKLLSDKGQYTAALQTLSVAPQRTQPFEVIVNVSPRLQSVARWQDTQLTLQWEATPGDDLNCRYVLQGYRMGGTMNAS